MNRLQDKVIVVAGAGGIGDELARRYTGEGAAVVLGDIDGDRAIATAETIAATGAACIGTLLDGGDEGSIRAAIDLAVGRFGGLDGLHANYAGFNDNDSLHDVTTIPMEDFDDVMRVGSRGFVLCTRHAIPEMLKRGGGSLVYTSSDAAFMGEVVRLAYAMSKVSMHALARHVAHRFGPQGIRANVICPGVVTHPRFEAALPAEIVEAFTDSTLLGRLGRPVDIAAMAALMMSDEGSYITGQVISVNGGALMRP
ncbi:MAG: SDR family oxidoreductase [Novosphingobium sp.]|nr:SDR family oxidoreductase [Novosphingobium sp.]